MKLVKMAHAVRESTCYVNGLYDLITWKGARYEYYLLPLVGGMAAFSYLKYQAAQPPCLVHWGISPQYMIKELSGIIGFTQMISEGKAYRNVFPVIKQSLDNDEPIIAGAVDMYYLHYYPKLYQKMHVPIHYLLVVGYDDTKKVVSVHDFTFPEYRRFPTMNLRNPWISAFRV
ncbi:BtrH N-terminal domain-containing protein [Chloroflexota bacterium]